MSFDPGLLSLLVNQQERERRDAMFEEERAQQRRDQGLSMLLQLAQEAPDVDVTKVAPALARRFNLGLDDINAAAEFQKGANASRKRQEKMAQTAAQAQSAAGVLTDTGVAPELTLPQVLGQLRAIESAGIMQDEAAGVPTGPRSGEALLGQLDIARTTARVRSREAAVKEQIQLARELREQTFTDEKALRGEYLNQSKDTITQRNAFDRVMASAEQADAAGDLALIFNFLKVLDPGSTVREGEFQQVGRAGGLPGEVQVFFKRLEGTGQLPTEMRNQIIKRSRALFQRGIAAQKALDREYRGLAQRNRLDPRNVVVDFVKRGGSERPVSPVEGLEFSHFDEESGNAIFVSTRGPDAGQVFEDVPDGP